MEHMLLTSLSMTPYDTGERLEPPSCGRPPTTRRRPAGSTSTTTRDARCSPPTSSARGLDYVLHVGQLVRQDHRRDGGGLLSEQPYSRQQS